jgi:hypothetical protein
MNKARVVFFLLFHSIGFSQSQIQNLVNQADEILIISSPRIEDSVMIDSVLYYEVSFGRTGHFYNKYNFPNATKLLCRELPDRSQSQAHFGKWIAFLKCDSRSCAPYPEHNINKRNEEDYKGALMLLPGGLLPYYGQEAPLIKQLVQEKTEPKTSVQSLYEYAGFVAHIKTGKTPIDSTLISGNMDMGPRFYKVKFTPLKIFKSNIDTLKPDTTQRSQLISMPNPLSLKNTVASFSMLYQYGPIEPSYLKENTEYLVFLRNAIRGDRVNLSAYISYGVIKKGLLLYRKSLGDTLELLSKGVDISYDENAQLKEEINTVLEKPDKTKDKNLPFSALPPNIQNGFFKDYKNDSVRIYFEQLDSLSIKDYLLFQKNFKYFKSNNFPYALLVASAHSDVALRKSAVVEIYKFLRLKYLICSTEESYIKREILEQEILKYYIFLLENYPPPVEFNVYQHNHYRHELMKCIDFITQEHIMSHPQTSVIKLDYTHEEMDRWKSNQNITCSSISPMFRTSISVCLGDTMHTNWRSNPLPPKLTCEVLAGLKTEFKLDSTQYHFNQLCEKAYFIEDMKVVLEYFRRQQLPYCLLANSVHWVPDIRYESVTKMWQYIAVKYKIRASPEWQKNRDAQEQVILQFYIHILENYPPPKSGGQILVGYNNYRQELLKCIDLITGENIIDKRNSLPGAYTSEEMKRWKLHLALSNEN